MNHVQDIIAIVPKKTVYKKLTGPDKEIVCGERKKITSGFGERRKINKEHVEQCNIASTECNQSAPVGVGL
ncbi:hypothetical protein GHT06_015543 [Daphnia sinensis]|uniref:Uncharacterized protein n=1 Tax=Daphnia sinensis TaxID=1820382 RepID=A0AAD5KR54_9CRUS|nr:hypothetical protein GHT06_015543 [Daphnia sinensis]